MFPQLIFTYQIILKNLTEVINQDHDFLKKVTQPKQVKEQLAQIGEDIYINNSVHKIMDGGTSVHEKKKPENKATTHQSYDQKTVSDQNRPKAKKMKTEVKIVVPDKETPCRQPFATPCSCCK